MPRFHFPNKIYQSGTDLSEVLKAVAEKAEEMSKISAKYTIVEVEENVANEGDVPVVSTKYYLKNLKTDSKREIEVATNEKLPGFYTASVSCIGM